MMPAIPDRPLLTVGETLRVVPLSERSLRRALEPGGDLEHLAVRVGRRVFVKRAELLRLVGAASVVPLSARADEFAAEWRAAMGHASDDPRDT
jgi:hypothetical protein